MNLHCGRHDKIYTESSPCPGCKTEAEQTTSKETAPSSSSLPDGPDKLTQILSEYEKRLRRLFGKSDVS